MPIVTLSINDFQKLKEDYDAKQREKEENKKDKITRQKSIKIGGNKKKKYKIPSFF